MGSRNHLPPQQSPGKETQIDKKLFHQAWNYAEVYFPTTVRIIFPVLKSVKFYLMDYNPSMHTAQLTWVQQDEKANLCNYFIL